MPEKPTTRYQPDPHRPRPIKEQLHEAINANITDTVKNGFQGIDRAKEKGLRELEKRGIKGMEEIADSAADLVKKLFLRGISK